MFSCCNYRNLKDAVFMGHFRQCTMEAGMAWIDDGPKDTLAELFEILYEQMNKQEFWVADNQFLIRVGEARRNFLDSLKELQQNEDCSDEDF